MPTTLDPQADGLRWVRPPAGSTDKEWVTRDEADSLWEVHTCAEHGYEGVPFCPWPDCPNGKNTDLYRTVRMHPLARTEPRTVEGPRLDWYHFGIERIFFRDRDADKWFWVEVAKLPDPPKAKFLAACSEWADLLIADSARHADQGGPRWDIVPEKMIPSGELRVITMNGHIDFPPAQTKVWLAGYQLMLDSYDAIAATKATKEPHE